MLFHNWRKTISFLAVLILILLALTWTNLRFNRQPLLVFLQNSARDLLAPIQNQIESSFTWLQEGITSLQELGNLRQDNLRLKQENDALLELALNYKAAQEEIDRLRELLEYKSDIANFAVVTARIISWPSTWPSRSMLNVGSRNGILIDMPVRTPRGLIGRIVQVSASSSELMLLNDTSSGVGGRNLSDGSLGIVRGQGSQNPHLKMINISLDADIRPGDSIVTSGLGDTFPEGILIGTVVSVDNDPSGQHKTAILQMAVDIYRLHEVQVLLPMPEDPIDDNTDSGVDP
ncbi:MAG: rod shape-determining protein MreC [Symbiobacteriaceae bacterium]|nr:rod shape-determining protein MreC [Symbiobacteriaceae bacterium]